MNEAYNTSCTLLQQLFASDLFYTLTDLNVRLKVGLWAGHLQEVSCLILHLKKKMLRFLLSLFLFTDPVLLIFNCVSRGHNLSIKQTFTSLKDIEEFGEF